MRTTEVAKLTIPVYVIRNKRNNFGLTYSPGNNFFEYS